MICALPFNYVDLVVLAIAVITGLIGFKKGFIKEIGKIVTIVATVVLCISFFKIVANFIMNLDIVASWGEKFEEWLNEKNDLFATNIREGGEEAIRTALSSIKIPEVIIDTILNKVDFTASLPDTTIAKFCATRLIQYGCYAISFLALFIVSLIAVSIVVKLLSGIIKLIPFGGFINRLLGLTFNVLKFVIIIWAIFYALTFLSVVPALNELVTNFINSKILTEDSIIVKYIYEHNLLQTVIDALIAGNFSVDTLKIDW